MAICGGSSNNKAGRRFVLTWPEFGLVRSWFKGYMFLHVLLLNGAAFLVSIAKKGEVVPQDGKDMLANIMLFVVFLSTTASAANALHEVEGKAKSWNWFKGLILTALLVVNFCIIHISYSKKRDGVSEGEEENSANWQIILYIVSCFLTGVTSFIKLVHKESEAKVDDHDLEMAGKL